MHKYLLFFFYFFFCDFVCVCLLVHNQKPCLRSSSACDRQTHREDSAKLASSEFSLLYYIFKYIYINKYMHKYLFFFFLLFLKLILCVFLLPFFETDFVCVCLLVWCPEATLTQFQCLRQTDTPRGQRPASLQRVFPPDRKSTRIS